MPLRPVEGVALGFALGEFLQMAGAANRRVGQAKVALVIGLAHAQDLDMAVHAAHLRQELALVEEAITQHIDKEVLHTTTVAEQSERELLRAWGKQLEAGAP